MIIYHKHLTIEEAIPKLEELAQKESAVQILVDFVKENGRGIIR